MSPRHRPRPQGTPQLFEDWETETMHAHDWPRGLGENPGMR
ncbi:hypothetical protein ACOBQB_00610 [Streptomyces sp. G5(2025)]